METILFEGFQSSVQKWSFSFVEADLSVISVNVRTNCKYTVAYGYREESTRLMWVLIDLFICIIIHPSFAKLQGQTLVTSIFQRSWKLNFRFTLNLQKQGNRNSRVSEKYRKSSSRAERRWRWATIYARVDFHEDEKSSTDKFDRASIFLDF